MKPREEILAAIQDEVRDSQLELIEAEWLGPRGRRVLRVTVDKPEGVTLEECAALSQKVSARLDILDPSSERYRLEVCSPGLDRPLKTEADYVRFQGRLARITASEPGEEHFTTYRGRLAGYEGGWVNLVLDEGDIKRFRVENIRKARLEPET